jgi:hypothetical protein
MERSVTVNETGWIRLNTKLVEKEKERNAWTGVILKKLTVAELLSDIPQFNGT